MAKTFNSSLKGTIVVISRKPPFIKVRFIPVPFKPNDLNDIEEDRCFSINLSHFSFHKELRLKKSIFRPKIKDNSVIVANIEVKRVPPLKIGHLTL